MADRLYYSIVLKRPNGDLSKFRFPHAWDGEAARVTPYRTLPPTDAYDLLTEAGTTLITESGDTLVTEAAP